MTCGICGKVIAPTADNGMVAGEKTEGRVVHEKCYEAKFGENLLKNLVQEGFADARDGKLVDGDEYFSEWKERINNTDQK